MYTHTEFNKVIKLRKYLKNYVLIFTTKINI